MTPAQIDKLALDHCIGVEPGIGHVFDQATYQAFAQAVRGLDRAELAVALNTVLWLYRRLPYAYGSPPFVTQAILTLAEQAGVDVADAIREREAVTAVHDAPYDR